MRVSIIIPAHNEERLIKKCIESLLSQSVKPLELIVIDDHSTDKTASIIKKFKEVKLIEFKDNKGPSVARNTGWHKARGDVILFAEADAYYEHDYLKKMLVELKPGVGGVISMPRKAIDKTVWTRMAELEMSARSEDYKPFSAFMYKKEALQKTGGYDENLRCGEDVDLGRRVKIAGYSLAHSKALIYHKEPSTLKAVYKRYSWTGGHINGFNKKWHIKPLTRFIDAMLIIAVPLLFYKLIGLLVIAFTLMTYLATKKQIISYTTRKEPRSLLMMIIYLLVKRLSITAGLIKSFIRKD